MLKKVKKLVSLVLVLALSFAICVPTFAANASVHIQNSKKYEYCLTDEIHSWHDIAILSEELNNFTVEHPNSTEDEQNKFLIDFVQSGKLRFASEITPDYYIPGAGDLDLNDEEIKLAASNPFNAVKAYDAANRATDLTIQYYGKNGWQDNSDAFRHCSWSALMKKSIGTSAAQKWGNAHEADSSGVDKQMDLYNNKIGRSVNTSGSETSIVNSVKSLVKSGKLRRIVNGKLVATDGSGLK